MEMKSRRILIVDDNQAIHEDMHNILSPTLKPGKDVETQILEEELFGTNLSSSLPDAGKQPEYVIDDAYQGQEAIQMVDTAAKEGFPYALIFMDVRMPPGIDGIQAVTEIWKKHPQIEIVICTAYSDYSWDQIKSRFGSTEHLLFMKKPFDTIAVRQVALSLTSKWDNANQNKRYVEKLETEIKERTKELESVVERLKQIKEDAAEETLAKNSYFSSISSELQTPLNGIMGITDLLLDTELNEEQRSFAETIKSSGSTLLLAINDILNKTNALEHTLESNKILFELRSTLEAVFDLVSNAASENGIEIAYYIDTKIDDFLRGDPFPIRQLLLSLISQFLRSKRPGDIIVSVTKSGPDNDTELTLLFELCQLSAEGEEAANFGLNGASTQYSRDILDEAKWSDRNQIINLAKLLGGEFGAREDPKKGKVFWFSGSFIRQQKVIYPSVKLPSTIIGLRCLIVSDYPTGRKILSLHINHWGGICKEAAGDDNIAEKVISARESNAPFDVVLIDLKNEDVNRYQVLVKEIINRCTNMGIFPPKLICLTANANRGDAQKIKDFGYNAYLTKPIKQSHLFKTLLLVKSVKDGNQSLDPSLLITKHLVDEFSPDYYKVFLAEEDPQELRKIVTSLARLKVRCDVSIDQGDILEELNGKNYDLALIDCQPFVGDDSHFKQQISSIHRAIKTIFLVKADQTAIKEQLKGLEAICLEKPIRREDLLDTLRRSLLQ